MSYYNVEGIITKEYRIATDGNANRKQVDFPKHQRGIYRIVLEAVDADVTFNFGDSTVTADDTIADDALADGNFTITDGAIFQINVESSVTHVSTLGATGGYAVIKLINKQ